MFYPHDLGFIPNYDFSDQNEDRRESNDAEDTFKQTIDSINLEDTTSKTSNGSSILEIGYKQNIIENLKKYEKAYENHLIQMKSFIKMSELYLDAAKQIYKFEADETFKNYEISENNKVENCKERIDLIELYLKDVNDCQNLLKTNVTIGTADLILEKIKKSYAKRDMTFNKNLEYIRPIFIYKYLDSCNMNEKEHKNKTLENQVIITVIGKRGAGKSSFINAFRNLNSYDDNAARTDDVECTLLSKFYPLETYDQQDNSATANPTSKIFLLDFPGVGTENFPSRDYTEMLLSMQSDAFIYLFQYTIEDLDLKILSEIQSQLKNKVPLFIVRNKIDMDFENYVCPLIGKQSLEDVSDMDALIDVHWYKMRHTMINHYENEMKSVLKLSSNQRVYFVSSDIFYKRFFDYEDLIKDLLKNLSENKSETLFKAFKKKCNQFKDFFTPKFIKEMRLL
jgi:GTPase SAR1 family protein